MHQCTDSAIDFDDRKSEEDRIYHSSRVFIARNGRHELTTPVLPTAQVQKLVARMLKSSVCPVDLASPFVDAMLPEATGSRSS